MARAKAKPTTPKTSRPARRKVASVSGIFGGSGLVALARLLKSPWDSILLYIAPALSVGIAEYGPKVLDKLVSGIEYVAKWLKIKHDIMQLRHFLKKAREAQKSGDLSPEQREVNEERIRAAEIAINNHEYAWIAPYLLGDSVSGLKETGADEATPEESTTPEVQEETT